MISVKSTMVSLLRGSLGAAVLLSSLSAGAEDAWTLPRALEQARRANPDVVSARHRLAAAQAQLAQARAALWPRVVAETGYTVTDNPPAAFMAVLNQRQLSFDRDFNDPDTTDNWGSELRVEYPLYTGGARRASIEASSLGVGAAMDEWQALQRRLALEVTEAFYAIFLAKDLITIAGDARTRHHANLDLAKNLVESGVALPTAVLDLEVKIAEAEADLEVARGAHAIRLEFLQTLLGLESEAAIRVSPDMPLLASASSGQMGERPDLSAIAKRRAQADQQVQIAEAGRRPNVEAFASARHDEGFTESGGGNSWMVGVALKWDVFDGGKVRAEIQEAEARRAAAREAERQKRLQIRLEIAEAETGLRSAAARMTHAGTAIVSAEASLNITQARFGDGLALATELIDAETALSSARVRLARARAEEQIARARHRHALGLPVLEGTPIASP